MKQSNSVKDRSLRLSSKPEEQFTSGKIQQILENNKYFPHLYDPYYDRKDVKAGFIKILDKERQEMSQDKMLEMVGRNNSLK